MNFVWWHTTADEKLDWRKRLRFSSFIVFWSVCLSLCLSFRLFICLLFYYFALILHKHFVRIQIGKATKRTKLNGFHWEGWSMSNLDEIIFPLFCLFCLKIVDWKSYQSLIAEVYQLCLCFIECPARHRYFVGDVSIALISLFPLNRSPISSFCC